MRKQAILLTGGSGFIGRNIKEQLNDKYIIHSPSKLDLDLLDSSSVDNFFNNTKVDFVIHCANIGGNRKTPYLKDAVEQNLRMFVNLINKDRYFEKLIQFGSGAEYDKSIPIIKITEDKFGRSIPRDQYGFLKYISSLISKTNKKIIVIRPFGVFGRYEDISSRFISQSICKALMDYPIIIKQDAYFDYLYIDDLVRIIDKVLNINSKFRFLNVGSGRRVSLHMLALNINNLCNNKARIILKKQGFQNEYTCDITNLKNALPDLKFTNINKSLKELIYWYRENPDLYKNIRNLKNLT